MNVHEAGMMRTCRILGVTPHGESVVTLRLPRLFEAIPGQFVTLWLPGVDEKPFSISGTIPDAMEVSVKAVGPFTERLVRCRPGDRIGIRGPFGTGFVAQPGALLVGGGIGAAPLRFLAQVMAERSMPFTMVCGARTEREIPFREDLARWGCLLSTDDGTCGECGVATDVARRLAEGERFSCVYAAGPEPMLVQVMALAEAKGLPCQISFERYMKCGIGLCGSCCLDGSGIRLCVEGPVLSAEQARQVTEFGLPHRDASGLRRR